MTAPSLPDAGLLSVKALSKRLSISEGHIYRLVAEKRVPYTRIGALLRFDPKAIDAWLEERKVEVVK